MIDSNDPLAPTAPSPIRRWRVKDGVVIPTAEAMALDLERMPAGLPWEWASERLVAVVRGERIPVVDSVTLERAGFDVPEAYVTREMAPGVRVGFVVSCGVASLNVNQSMIDSWGVTIEDVTAHAMAGLLRQVRISRSVVEVDTSEEGWPPVSSIRGDAWWASSLVLLPDELMRIYGEHDQIFAAPYSCLLLSVPIDTDLETVADIVDLYGYVNPTSLLIGLPAFVLRDRELSAQRLPEWEPSDDTVFMDDLYGNLGI